MADYYVRSGATGAANGANWTDAYTAIEGGAEAVSGSGNRLFVADGHSESHATNITLAFGGADGTGVFECLVVDDTGNPTPPTAITTGAVVATTGAATIQINGHGRIRGMTFKAGDSTNSPTLSIQGSNNAALVCDSCEFELRGTGSSGRMDIGVAAAASSARLVFNNCTFRLGNAGQEMRVTGTGAEVLFVGGGLAGSATLILMRMHPSYLPRLTMIGFDASAGATSMVLLDAVIEGRGGAHKFINLTLPAGWTGTVVNVRPYPGQKAELIDSTDGTTRYRYWCEQAYGTIRDSIHLGQTVYLDGGQYDGVARYSLRFASNAYTNQAGTWLVGPDMHGYAETAAASTATVQILHDGASALTNADCWLELFVDGQWISGERANPLAAGTAHTASGQTWTGASGTGPNGSATWNALKLTCGFTPAAAGPVMGRVVVAKASTTVYVDTNLTVTVN